MGISVISTEKCDCFLYYIVESRASRSWATEGRRSSGIRSLQKYFFDDCTWNTNIQSDLQDCLNHKHKP